MSAPGLVGTSFTLSDLPALAEYAGIRRSDDPSALRCLRTRTPGQGVGPIRGGGAPRPAPRKNGFPLGRVVSALGVSLRVWPLRVTGSSPAGHREIDLKPHSDLSALGGAFMCRLLWLAVGSFRARTGLGGVPTRPAGMPHRRRRQPFDTNAVIITSVANRLTAITANSIPLIPEHLLRAATPG
jgi:hypothetical protein